MTRWEHPQQSGPFLKKRMTRKIKKRGGKKASTLAYRLWGSVADPLQALVLLLEMEAVMAPSAMLVASSSSSASSRRGLRLWLLFPLSFVFPLGSCSELNTFVKWYDHWNKTFYTTEYCEVCWPTGETDLDLFLESLFFSSGAVSNVISMPNPSSSPSVWSLARKSMGNEEEA